MKVTFRIPSKKVQYGYLEVEDDQSWAVMPSPLELAEHYAQFILDYQAAEKMAFENPTASQIKKADANDDINAAAQVIKDELGATELSPEEAAKPWNKTEEPTSSKPWSEPTAAPAVADSDWDF